jgi:hypothetical protein
MMMKTRKSRWASFAYLSLEEFYGATTELGESLHSQFSQENQAQAKEAHTMQIVVVTPKGRPYRVSSITLSLVTFLFCCLIVLGGVAFLMGVLFQLLALLSPFLITSGLAVLKLSVGAFVVYRVTLWLWRLVLRPLWISSYPYRRNLFFHLRSLIRLFAVVLFLVLFQ